VRELFLEALFEILGASEGNTIKLDARENLHDIKIIRKKYSELDEETRAVLTKFSDSFKAEAKRTLSATIKEKMPRKK
jgi:hypothetical protein